MRILHTSDWHLGRRLHSADLGPAQRDFLTWLLATAQAEQVAAVVVAGDVYDRALPPPEAVQLLDDTVAAFAEAGIPLLLTAGNHDSAIRLRFGARVMAAAGIRVCGDLTAATEPLVLSDDDGPVAIYGVPYLVPDLVMDELGADRSHESVLSAVVKRIIDDASARGITRTVVAAHAFVRGGAASDSERGISVGGIGDVPASVFDGIGYVALGHLHGPQDVRLDDSATTVAYSGSPLAYSFSERDHRKSVCLVNLDAAGAATVTRLAVPVERPLRQVRGRLADLLGRAAPGGDLEQLRDSYVKVVLTDPDRPEAPMDRLRRVWPHTLELVMEPDVSGRDADRDLSLLRQAHDPATITGLFVEYVTGQAVTADQAAVIQEAVTHLQQAEVQA